MITFTVDLGGYPAGGSVSRRTAVRGIIRRGGKYLLVAGKYGDCKFPGGGTEPGETLEEALSREIREETGYHLKPGSAVEWGVVTERRKGMLADILEMDSTYFLCEAEGSGGEQSLDIGEAEDGLRPVWMDLQEALAVNRRLESAEGKGTPQIIREIKVMEQLLEDGGGAP